MNLEEAIKNRRSVRNFTDQKINKEVFKKIIEAGNNAPSHCNTQGWKFILVTDQELKNSVFKNGGSHVVKNSPYGILVVYDLSKSDNLEYADWIQSSSAAVQNMLLTIHEQGMGGCWVCHLPRKDTLSKIFSIPKPYSPVAYLAFGYPLNKAQNIPRKNEIKDILAINKFVWPSESVSTKTIIKRKLRRIYFILPTSIKKTINPLVDKFVKKFHN